MKDALTTNGTNVNSSLISNGWSKLDLEQVLGSSTSKLLSINAHFDHNQALPADQSASDVQSDPVDANDLTDQGGRRLLFSMGCHAGLSVSDVSLGLTGSIDADWHPTGRSARRHAATCSSATRATATATPTSSPRPRS